MAVAYHGAWKKGVRVLHVTDGLAGVSGIRSYVEGLTDEAAGSGPELEVFAPSGDLRK